MIFETLPMSVSFEVSAADASQDVIQSIPNCVYKSFPVNKGEQNS
jgi:hypothetical protein